MYPGVTAKKFRRFYAVYAYFFFGKSTFLGASTQASLNGFDSYMLGHATLDDQVIAYSSLVLQPAPKLKLFELGR